MKVSEVIEKLSTIHAEFGDVEFEVWDFEDFNHKIVFIEKDCAYDLDKKAFIPTACIGVTHVEY